ncbi:MAG: alginate O-acetyltransferase AlgX-related protein [Gemmatimonadaceae bacterium]
MNSSPRLRRFTRVAAIGLVLFVSVLLALLLGEVAIRIGAPQQLIQIRPDLWEPVDTLGWNRRANVSGQINTGERTVTLQSDAKGYRVGASGRTEASTQILLMGDSFMEAIQVEHEQSTAYVLEQTVAKELKRPVAVRNGGVTGWSPNQYLLRTRQLLARDTFAVIVVGIFVGNDAVAYRLDRVPPREPVARHDLRFPKRFAWREFVDAVLAPVNDGLEVRSHLYVLGKNQLSTLRMRLGVTADYLPVEYRRDEATSNRWRNTAAIAADLARAGAARRVPVVFVLIPERFQVYPDEFSRYLKGFGIDSAAVDVDQPSRLLTEAMRAEKLRVVDALAPMRAAAANGPRLYGTVDQHLSPAGHQALADVIVPELLPLLRR